MTGIAKPKYCEQQWLDMKSTNEGRICGQCNKKIVDFSKMRWSEIEQIQNINNNTVCGMYHPKQLDNWGQETSTRKDKLLKILAITGLTVTLSVPSAYAQSIDTTNSIIINGKIIDSSTNEEIAFVHVKLKNHNIEAFTDDEGNFELILTNTISQPYPDTLELINPEYKTTKIYFEDLNKINSTNHSVKNSDGTLNISLAPDLNNDIIAYYVTKPTLKQRIKWKFKKWFGVKN